MRVKDTFKLPMTAEDEVIYAIGCNKTVRCDSSDLDCNEQATTVAMALNNHDALVESVRDLLYITTALKMTTTKAGDALSPAYQEMIGVARGLLARIEGEQQ